MADTDDTAARLAAIKEQVAQAMSTSWLDDDDSYRIANEVPWLLAYVEQLQRERDELRKVVDAKREDWTEDFAHENGNYHNRCAHCRVLFIGHKRRVVCHRCATNLATAVASGDVPLVTAATTAKTAETF